ncbi:MAG: cupin domain-containing protein, partial [Chloroflexota bacterium]
MTPQKETTHTYTLIDNLVELLPEISEDTIVSRSIHQDGQLKAILFGFAPGQELSEHTAARPAILHFLQGEAELKLGQDSFAAEPGTWAHMEAHLPHSIVAKSEV